MSTWQPGESAAESAVTRQAESLRGAGSTRSLYYIPHTQTHRQSNGTPHDGAEI